ARARSCRAPLSTAAGPEVAELAECRRDLAAAPRALDAARAAVWSMAAAVAASALPMGRPALRAADWFPTAHAHSCQAVAVPRLLRLAVSLSSFAGLKLRPGVRLGRRVHLALPPVHRGDPRAGPVPRRPLPASTRRRAGARDTWPQ